MRLPREITISGLWSQEVCIKVSLNFCCCCCFCFCHFYFAIVIRNRRYFIVKSTCCNVQPIVLFSTSDLVEKFKEYLPPKNLNKIILRERKSCLTFSDISISVKMGNLQSIFIKKMAFSSLLYQLQEVYNWNVQIWCNSLLFNSLYKRSYSLELVDSWIKKFVKNILAL